MLAPALSARGHDDVLFSSQVPEGTRDPKISEKSLCFLKSVPPPVWPHLVFVPTVGEPPPLFRGEDPSSREVSSQAPPIDVRFRPEEKHRRSRESNVVPPMMCGNGEVNDTFAPDEPAILHFNFH